MVALRARLDRDRGAAAAPRNAGRVHRLGLSAEVFLADGVCGVVLSYPPVVGGESGE